MGLGVGRLRYTLVRHHTHSYTILHPLRSASHGAAGLQAVQHSAAGREARRAGKAGKPGKALQRRVARGGMHASTSGGGGGGGGARAFLASPCHSQEPARPTPRADWLAGQLTHHFT